jgi:uncharacterized protein YbjT (DUF2867 family)
MNEAILVTSATGTVGREVVKQLAQQGAKVIAAAHLNGNAAKKEPISLPGVGVAEVDYRQPESLAEPMSQAGKLMLISPYTYDQVQLAGCTSSNESGQLRGKRKERIQGFWSCWPI